MNEFKDFNAVKPLKPTHHFETIEIGGFINKIAVKIHISIAIPPPEKRRGLELRILNNMFRKALNRIKLKFHDFIANNGVLK